MKNKSWRAGTIATPENSDIGYVTKLENRRIMVHWIEASQYWLVSTKALTEEGKILHNRTVMSDEAMQAQVAMVNEINAIREVV